MKSLDLDNLQKMIDEGYISVQKHPTEELYVYNYTQKCQYSHLWNNETIQCRGLILDKNYNIVARPFKKFWNMEEHLREDSILPPLPMGEDFEVYDKLDGSLGILYWIDNKPFIATRGSFTSDQAIEGTKMLKEMLKGVDLSLFDRRYTYLWEIIYPQNRIVVDYGQTRNLFLLAVINTQTGEELNLDQFRDKFLVVKKFDGIKDFTKVRDVLNRDNAEGFVIKFSSGVRTKIKYDEYVRLHRLVTGVNAKTIWDLLRHKQDFKELLDRVPDEFYQWVEKTRDDLLNKYKLIGIEALKIYDQVEDLPTRKDQALKINKQKTPYSAIVFTMLDGGDFSEIIWRMIKPKADKPWKEDDGA